MLTVIVKGTNGCNLACSYCSLGDKKKFMYVDLKMLEDMLCFSCKIARYRGESTVNFILHGGEPTLINPDIYKSAIDLVEMLFPDLDIIISMQSNGFVLTEKMLNFIREYSIHIGISIDGSEEIHNSERLTDEHKPTYHQVLNNIERLQNAGIKVSCLMVLTQNALNKGYEYLKFFEEKHIYLKINPLLNYGRVENHPELSLRQGDYANYLIGLYEYSIEKNISIMITPIDNILQAILNTQKIGECTFNRECNKHFLCIDYKGDVYPCGKFSDMDLFKLGNILTMPPESIDGRFAMYELQERRGNGLPEKCKKCRYLSLCNAGCSAEAVIEGNFDKEPLMCEDYKILFNYFQTTGLKLLKKELQKQKNILREKL